MIGINDFIFVNFVIVVLAKAMVKNRDSKIPPVCMISKYAESRGSSVVRGAPIIQSLRVNSCVSFKMYHSRPLATSLISLLAFRFNAK